MADEAKKTANAQQEYIVTANDLPLSCPMPDMALWDSHPKVFLPIEKTGSATCPYCGAIYKLETSEKPSISHD